MPNFYFRFKFEVENAEENKDFNKKNTANWSRR